MKRELRSFIMLTAIAIVLAPAGHAGAQTDSTRESEQQQAGDGAAGSTPGSASRSADGSPARRLAARVRRLQETMVKRLELDEKQLGAVNQLMEEFIRTLSAREDSQTPSDPRQMEWKRLRGEMIEAKKRGDSAAFHTLRREWMDRTNHLSQGSKPTGALVRSIDGVLNETQRRVFRRILQRVQLGTTATLPPNALTTMLRAARDPSLNLTVDQQTAIRKIVREEILAIPKERRDPEGMGGAVPAIRDRIMTALTPSQGTKFRALLDDCGANHLPNQNSKPVKRSETATPSKKSASGAGASESLHPDKD